MGKKEENCSFICVQCGKKVYALVSGYRNHCPHCLCSMHLDKKPGDRKNPCQGVMKHIRLVYKGGKGWQIVHRCQKCSQERPNIVAEDDNWELIFRLQK